MISPKFTPEQLAAVFLSRWMVRDIANRAISHLRPNTLLRKFEVVPEIVGRGETLKVRR